jgi:hypothetical protein
LAPGNDGAGSGKGPEPLKRNLSPAFSQNQLRRKEKSPWFGPVISFFKLLFSQIYECSLHQAFFEAWRGRDVFGILTRTRNRCGAHHRCGERIGCGLIKNTLQESKLIPQHRWSRKQWLKVPRRKNHFSEMSALLFYFSSAWRTPITPRISWQGLRSMVKS